MEHYREYFGWKPDPDDEKPHGSKRRLPGPTETPGAISFERNGKPRRTYTKEEREYLKRHPSLFPLDEVEAQPKKPE